LLLCSLALADDQGGMVPREAGLCTVCLGGLQQGQEVGQHAGEGGGLLQLGSSAHLDGVSHPEGAIWCALAENTEGRSLAERVVACVKAEGHKFSEFVFEVCPQDRTPFLSYPTISFWMRMNTDIHTNTHAYTHTY
jgi:hypothetical protein